MSDDLDGSTIARRLALMDAEIGELEHRFTVRGLSGILAVALIVAASIYVCPAIRPVSHGRYYAQLSLDPLHPVDNPNAHRILTPLISYLIGLRGDWILLTDLLIVLLFVAAVFQYARSKSFSPLVSACCAAAMAFSMPVLATIHFGGYPDAASCLLVLVMMMVRNPISFGALFLLALLNHEATVFLLPFHLIYAHDRGGWSRLMGWLLAALAALACYIAIRQHFLTASPTAHSASFYLSPLREDPTQGIKQVAAAYYAGWFSGFKLYWLFPILGVWFSWQRRADRKAALIVAPVICCMCQSLIAIDTSRMIAFAFPAVLLGVGTTLERLGKRQTELLFVALIGANFLVPQLYVWGNNIAVMRCLPMAVLKYLIWGA